MSLVADTSALVSIASTDSARRETLPLLLTGYDVAVPEQVIDELESIAQYEDEHGTAARAILEHREQLAVHAVELDPEFPLDAGENAAVQLAERIDASFLYCDEYNHLALVHASLSEAQLVTTPRLLKALVVRGKLSKSEARSMLEAIAEKRSWDGNAYVHQAAHLFD